MADLWNKSILLKKWQCTIYVLAVFSLFSCITINSSGFSALLPEYKEKVVPCQDAIEKLPNDGHIYLVTQEQLQQFLDKTDKVLVYEYLSYCTSTHCVNPIILEQACKKRGVLFCVIAECYDGVFSLPQMDLPIMAINPEPFRKKITKSCSREFFNKLTNSTWDTRGYGRYYLFEKGKYKGCFNDYTEALLCCS